MSDTLPPMPEPFDHCSEWNSPLGITRKFRRAFYNGSPPDRTVALFTADQMRAYAAAAVAMERERCAMLCEEYAGMHGTGAWTALIEAADRIRDPERAKRDAAFVRAG